MNKNNNQIINNLKNVGAVELFTTNKKTIYVP